MHIRVVTETNDGSIHHLDWKRCQLDISAASNEDCTTVIDFLYTLASILFLGSFHCSLCINTSRHLPCSQATHDTKKYKVMEKWLIKNLGAAWEGGYLYVHVLSHVLSRP